MEEKKVYVVFRESLIQSITSDLSTFSMLTFCIWFSSGSKLWSFVCFLMLFSFVSARAVKKINTAPKFRTIASLQTWVDSLKD